MQLRSPTIRRVLLLTAMAGAAGLPGCAGMKGTHTNELRADAAERMSQMKAATEYDMANQQFLAGDLEKAIRSVENSITMNEKVARSHVLRGRILIEQGRLEQALEPLAKAAELDPKSADPHYYSGIVLERFNEFERALEAYDLASAADPGNAQYLLASAEMLIDQGELDEAEERLLNARARFEHTAGVRQTLGHIALLRGEHDEASRYFSEAVLLAPDDLALLEDLARAQFGSGQYAQAETSLRRAQRDAELAKRTDLQLLRARCLVELNKPVEAREILLRAVASDDAQEDAQTWVDLGNVSLLLKDWLNVREAGRRITAIAPQRAEGYVLTAMAQRERGQLAQAVLTLDKAIALAPSDSTGPKLQGLMLRELGRDEEAARAFALAAQRDPRDQDSRRLIEAAGGETAVANAPVGE